MGFWDPVVAAVLLDPLPGYFVLLSLLSLLMLRASEGGPYQSERGFFTFFLVDSPTPLVVGGGVGVGGVGGGGGGVGDGGVG